MKKIAAIIITLVLCGGIANVSAQDLSNHYSYILNPYNINPAYTGYRSGISGVLNTRSQFTGVQNAPRNLMFGLTGAINDKMAVGGKIISDKRGFFQTIIAEATYSYRVKFAEENSLSFGISAGMVSRGLDQNGLLNNNYIDPTDPTIAGYDGAKLSFNSGFGMLYQYKGLEIGASSPSLFENGTDIHAHVVGSASYDIKIPNSQWIIKPTVIYQNIPVNPNTIDGLLKVQWKNLVWVQGGYRSQSSYLLSCGFNLDVVSVSYAYNMNSTPLSQLSNGSHEVMLAFNIKTAKKNKLKQGVAGVSEIDGQLNDIKKRLDVLLASNYESGQALVEIELIRKQLYNLLSNNKAENLEKVEADITAIRKKIDELVVRYGQK